MVSNGHQVDLVTFRPEPAFMKQIPKSVQIFDLKSSRSMFSIHRLAHYLTSRKPDALISAQSYANIISILAKFISRCQTKLVVTERLVMSSATAAAKNRRERLLPTLMRWLYPKADAIVGNSQAVAVDLVKFLRISPDRVKVIYNPTLSPDILKRAKEPVTHPWFKPDEPPVILGIGRLVLQKDFETLIRAFAVLRKQQSARLVILGEGPLREDFQLLIQELGIHKDVDLPGFTDNPYRFLKAASLFVLSSLYEGLPNALIEALAVGTPAISTDCPGGSREILNDGTAGPLVPMRDFDTMAQEMAELLANPQKGAKMVKDGQNSLSRFRPEICLESYLSILGAPIRN